MARERRVNLYELSRWIRAVAMSIGQDPNTFTILDAQDVCKVNTTIISFEDSMGLKNG